ncbi:MAG: phospholipase A [Tannerella sp.]|jgi:phospholipase A1|nr:phospholipase A [Tannerella sp.]
MIMKKRMLFTLFLFGSLSVAAQENPIFRNAKWDSIAVFMRERIEANKPAYNADSIRAILEEAPFFSLYKDNYFIGGIPIGSKIQAANSNVKFQLSVSQKLTRSVLPFDTYLFIQFTQKTIWNVLEESLPMHDMNFNPGIGLGHLIIHKNKYIGHAYLLVEHESNGKDNESSRSWNRIALGANLLASKNTEVRMKAWVPIVDGENNRDITRYAGLAQFTWSYYLPNRRLNAALITTWRSHSFNFNTQWELSYKFGNNNNQYLFLQYYNGYGENLLDYNIYHSVLRFGFVIKPEGITFF